MGSSSSPGQMPQFDANAVSQQQYQTNVNTGVANAYLQNTNQVTPQGTLSYTPTGTHNINGVDVPSFTATQTLSPEQQQIYNKTTGLQNQALDLGPNVLHQVAQSTASPINFSGLPPMPTDQTAARDQAYSALTARSNQDLDRQQQQEATQLANQGISAGSDAWKNAMLPIERARVDASNQATINAGTIAGQNISQAQTLRNQGINETLTQHNQPLQDYAQLLGLGGGVTSPTYAPGVQASIPATDVTSPAIAAYQGQVAAFNNAQQANNSMMGGLFGLGGSVLGGLGQGWAFKGFPGIG